MALVKTKMNQGFKLSATDESSLTLTYGSSEGQALGGYLESAVIVYTGSVTPGTAVSVKITRNSKTITLASSSDASASYIFEQQVDKTPLHYGDVIALAGPAPGGGTVDAYLYFKYA